MLNTPHPHIFLSYTMPIVILKTRKGLTRDQKRRIVSEFTGTLVNTTGIKPELVTILIEEKELEDIGKAGKLRCDEG
jgi:4-oxalocrotonate tautomerase family enzyme